MKCLAEKLLTCQGSDVLWDSRTTGGICAAELTQAMAKFPFSALYGKRVAIGDLPVIEFALSLVFLDGIASTILLLPSEEDPQSRIERLAQENIDIVVENKGLQLTELLASASSSKTFDLPIRCATTWLLPTSGTTGAPKLIPHTFASLTRSMTSRRLGGAYVWGSLYSLRRFAGLQVFLQAWLCNTPIVLNEDDDELTDIINLLVQKGCNSLSATPSMWRKLSMHPSFDKLALRQITLGGEIVDQPVLDMLSKRFPDSRITHIYASTEAGVGFAVSDRKAGFPVEYLRKLPGDMNIRLDERDHLWFGLKSEKIHDLDDQINWVDSGDVVAINDDRVYFLGRSNGSINVGGNKVMPEEIETVIKELPDIAFVQVRARKSAMLGNLVEAAVITRPGHNFNADLKKRIIKYCRGRLDDFKVPAFIVEVNEIQLTSAGKILRKY